MAAAEEPTSAERPRPKRARLDPATRRAQLVEVALAQLDTNGLAALGVDDVADAAGVSRSLVYAYFGDRDGLAAEVYVRILDRLDQDLGLDLPADGPALRSIVADCMRFAGRNRAAWRMLVSDPCRQHPTVRQARAERAVRISARWSEGDAGGPARGVASAGGASPDGAAGQLAGAHLAAEAALGMLESGVLHWLDHQDDMPAEEAAGLLATILWSGLTTRMHPDGDLNS